MTRLTKMKRNINQTFFSFFIACHHFLKTEGQFQKFENFYLDKLNELQKQFKITDNNWNVLKKYHHVLFFSETNCNFLNISTDLATMKNYATKQELNGFDLLHTFLTNPFYISNITFQQVINNMAPAISISSYLSQIRCLHTNTFQHYVILQGHIQLLANTPQKEELTKKIENYFFDWRLIPGNFDDIQTLNSYYNIIPLQSSINDEDKEKILLGNSAQIGHTLKNINLTIQALFSERYVWHSNLIIECHTELFQQISNGK